MEAFLSSYLPILIYILLCILIILLIVICVKVIKAMNRVEEIIDDVDEKVKSLNGIFSIVDNVTDKLSALTEVISDSIILFIKGIFRRRKRKIERDMETEEFEDDEEEA
ncbi:MAG: hypothetical protein U0M66_01450 [Bacilli bacterium]|jgi:hypothetical protein|nr:hypothetical protein [Bacilli bacterium]